MIVIYYPPPPTLPPLTWPLPLCCRADDPPGGKGHTPTRPRRRSFTRSCVDVLGVLVGNVQGLGLGVQEQGPGLAEGQGLASTQGPGLVLAQGPEQGLRSAVGQGLHSQPRLVDSSDDDEGDDDCDEDDDGVLEVWRDAGDDETSPVKSPRSPVKSPRSPVKSADCDSDIFSPSKVDNFYDFEVDDSGSDDDEEGAAGEGEGEGEGGGVGGVAEVGGVVEEGKDEDGGVESSESDEKKDDRADDDGSSDDNSTDDSGDNDDDVVALCHMTKTNTQRNALITFTLAVIPPSPPPHTPHLFLPPLRVPPPYR